jgi:peroxiredoxin
MRPRVIWQSVGIGQNSFRLCLSVIFVALLCLAALTPETQIYAQEQATSTQTQPATNTAPAQPAQAQPAASPAAEKQSQPASRRGRGRRGTRSPLEEGPQRKLTIRASDAQTEAPLAGVELQVVARINNLNANRDLLTNIDGLAEYSLPVAATVQTFRVTARKARFVPAQHNWRTDQARIELPDAIDISMAAGHPIGGVVKNEAGEPIAAAEVRLSMPITWPRDDNFYFTVATLATDNQGRWQFDGAPADQPNVHVNVRHPDYIPLGIAGSLSNENVYVLKQGPTVRGDIVDEQGKPVGFARVLLGDSRFHSNRVVATSDADGLFVLKNCTLGTTLISVQSDAHAPAAQQIVVAAQNEPLRFVLGAAHIVRGRVVDPDGKPISGVGVAPEYWRGMQVLEARMTTDAEGRFEWRAAPPDGLQFSIFHRGHMSLRNHPLAANGEEQVITMRPELVVSGRTIDATTGEPIKNFRVQRGQWMGGNERAYWYDGTAATTFTNGEFSYRFSEPADAWLLRAEADGYLPAESRPFKSDEGQVRFNFELKPGKGPSSVVLQASGEPAVGAEVGAFTEDTYVHLEQGRFGSQSRANLITTDKDGRFSMAPRSESEAYTVVVLHDAGFAYVSHDELQKSERIKLTAWGRLEGRVMKGAQPDADCRVMFYPQRQARGNSLRDRLWSFSTETTADADGRFRFERVPPGPGMVSRVVVTRYGDHWTHTPGWNQTVDISGGKTTNVTIGGTGRPVTGRVTIDGEPDEPITWGTNEPAAISPRRAPARSLLGALFGGGGAPAANTRYLGPIDETGQFTIPDVPAGDYTLTIDVNGPVRPNGFRNEPIGRATFDFTVPEMPEGRSDESLDLGVVKAVLFEVLAPGKNAPDFQLTGVDGKAIRKSDFGGKLMLLSFMSGGRDSDAASVQMLKRMHEQFGKDANFVILTVWCGSDSQFIKQTIEANSLKWPQAIVSHLGERVPQAYMVRTLPATFVISANGRVLARNPKEEELKRLLDSMLSLGELFELDK